MTLDNHALEAANYALENKCEVDVYIEHEVMEVVVVEDVPLLTFNQADVQHREKGEGPAEVDAMRDAKGK